jgi:hypothetical protein
VRKTALLLSEKRELAHQINHREVLENQDGSVDVETFEERKESQVDRLQPQVQ